jgi:alkylation response protein AidB-like acyl-CoA dehydrogenase
VKHFITNGTVASWMVIFATKDKSLRHGGISCFVMPADTPGITTHKMKGKLGQRASDTAEIVLEDVKLPASALVGKEGEGFKIAMQTLDFTRPGTAIGAVGVAQAAFELAVDYAKERVQFGMPIAMNRA